MNALSRVDSYFTNMDLPWEKNKNPNQVLLSVGVIEALIQPKAGVLEFERIWCKSNKSQAICMSWSDAMSSLAIGFDSGAYEILTVDTQNPLSYKETYASTMHKSRIMGIWIDGMRSLCYSISEDKTMKVTDLKVKEVIADIVITSTKLTCLEIDSENKTAFIADRGGQIHIYDLIPLKPTFIQIITTPSKGSLRGLFYDNVQQLLFASCFDDGLIHGYKLNSNGSKVSKFFNFIGLQSAENGHIWKSKECQTHLLLGFKTRIVCRICRGFTYCIQN